MKNFKNKNIKLLEYSIKLIFCAFIVSFTLTSTPEFIGIFPQRAASAQQNQNGADLSLLAKNEVDRLVKYCATLGSLVSGRYIDFYSTELTFGRARLVKIGERLAAFEVPVISNLDYTARFLYFSPSGALLQSPAAETLGARYFLTLREWNEISAVPAVATNEYFSQYNPSYNAQPFPYLFNERSQGVYELLGLPLEADALKDYNIIDYLLDVPSKVIGRAGLKTGSSEFQEPGTELPALKSLSYAAAFCADWWHITASSSSEVAFERYRDFINSKIAFGVNPRTLESLYVSRSVQNPEFFTFSRFIRDPLYINEPLTSSLEAYASILVLPEEYKIEDRSVKDRAYNINRVEKFYMGEEYIELFKQYEGTDETLIAALETHGIILGGLSFYMKGLPVTHSVKGVAIVGHKKIGRETLFVYKDFEDPAKIYRLAPVTFFREAYCFAHEFHARAKYIAKKRKLTIETTNQNGHNIDIDSIEATFPDEEKNIKFLKEAQGCYFHQVKKEDFAGMDRAMLIADIKKKYFVKGDSEVFNLKYAIY